MRKHTLVLVVLGFVACGLALSSPDVDVLGEGVSSHDVVGIGKILSNPKDFEGKTVRVRGEVSGVCPKMGCWMNLKGKEGQTIQIKVEDGVIVFPASAVGKEAFAEGKVEVLDLTREEYVEMLKHFAEEAGKTFDESSIGDPPYQMIRVKATGAEVAR